MFLKDLSLFIENIDFTIIAAAINKNKLNEHYATPDNPYHICLQFILERAVMYLGRSNEKLMFRIESRETHNDQKLAEIYEKFRNKNHTLFTVEEIHSKFLDLSFNQKIQNIIGMQVADLVAYPIGRKILSPDAVNNPFQIIESKFHRKPGTNIYKNYGLKVFP